MTKDEAMKQAKRYMAETGESQLILRIRDYYIAVPYRDYVIAQVEHNPDVEVRVLPAPYSNH